VHAANEIKDLRAPAGPRVSGIADTLMALQADRLVHQRLALSADPDTAQRADCTVAAATA
jgi:hypothetical protein